jgi:hypothetical protein
MKFLMAVHADAHTKSGLPPDPKLMAAIGELGAKMMKAGKMITTGGLGWNLPGIEVRANEGKLIITDGPYTETKELLAGFALFELASREEAIECAKEFMQVHIDILGPSFNGSMEIHEYFGPPIG